MIELARLSPEERQRRISKAQSLVSADERAALDYLNVTCGFDLGPLALTEVLSGYWPRTMRHVSESAGIVGDAMRRAQRILEEGE